MSTEFIATRYPDIISDAPYKHYDEELAKEYVENAEVFFEWMEGKFFKSFEK